jgi:hypothetical protein
MSEVYHSLLSMANIKTHEIIHVDMIQYTRYTLR